MPTTIIIFPTLKHMCGKKSVQNVSYLNFNLALTIFLKKIFRIEENPIIELNNWKEETKNITCSVIKVFLRPDWIVCTQKPP